MKRLPKYLICALVIGLGVLAAAAFLNRHANSPSGSVRQASGADAVTSQSDPAAALSAMAVDSSTTEPRRRRWAGMVPDATATTTATTDVTESTVVRPAVESELTAAKIEVPGAVAAASPALVGDAASDVNGTSSGSSGGLGIAPVNAIAAQGGFNGGSAGGAGGMGLGLGAVQGGQLNDGLGGGGGAGGGAGGYGGGSGSLSAANPSTSTGSGTTSEASTSGTESNSTASSGNTSTAGNTSSGNSAANNTTSSGNPSNSAAAANSSAASNSSSAGNSGSSAAGNSSTSSTASNALPATPGAGANNSPAASEGPLAVTSSIVTPPVADLIAAAISNTTSSTTPTSSVAPGAAGSTSADASAIDQGGLGNAQLTGSGSSWDNPLVPDANGVFHLQVTDPAQQFFLDPPPAIGYDYLVLSGPFVASVTLPSFGDNLYDIYGFSGGNPVLLATDWQAGVQFNFGGAGVDHFRILGIDGLPDGQPFVAALTFVSEGNVDIQATPILQTPEPPTFALAGIGLAGVVLWAWRRRRAVVAA
ncbi:MAG: PEP-CTERM sorting domain-containing protein [Planctomycetia bacterium]|nr:PEP-CTERM sorting domain-containing protein [Planctomycetia bacterium]